MKPQTVRVLNQLRHGPVGSMAFQPPTVCDGGRPITRVAPRVLELRELGFVIRSERAANGTAIYTLTHDAERATTSDAKPQSPDRGRTLPAQSGPGTTPYTDPPREGNAAPTTVEASTKARGSVSPNRIAAVSGTGDEPDPASGADLTGPNDAPGHTSPAGYTAGRLRGQCQHGPSRDPVNGASAISRVADANLQDGALFDADQYATERRYEDAA